MAEFATVLAIDPGYERSAWCGLVDGAVAALATVSNPALLGSLDISRGVSPLVIEDMESYGMPVGREVLRTVLWTGRMFERFVALKDSRQTAYLLPRRLVKLTLCGTSRAKDANVRQAVIDALGEPPTKARPNANYPRRPVADEWSAIALALTWARLAAEGRLGELETVRSADMEDVTR